MSEPAFDPTPTVEKAIGEMEHEAETDRQKYDPPLLAGKYKTAGELERAYREAQELIGRQGSELEQLRRLREQPQPEGDDGDGDFLDGDLDGVELEDDLDAPPTFTPPGDLHDTVDQLAFEEGNYAAAAQLALQAGRQDLLEEVLDAWYDEAPREASRFDRLLERQQEQVALAVQAQNQAQVADAYRKVSAAHSDFAELEGKMTEILERDPGLLADLGADPQRVIERLYRVAKAEAAENHVPYVASQRTVPSPSGERRKGRDPLYQAVERGISLLEPEGD